MSEIKVGEYVRIARNQGINKIIEINEDGFFILDDVIADEWGDETDRISPQNMDNEILNHSFEPIDLIEEGDYVNGHRVKAVYLDGVTKYIKLDNSYEDRKGVRTYSEDIKSILTKQQFSNIEYKVVENASITN